MKANDVQKKICEVIKSQVSYWESSNDINSPTHLSDIKEECGAQLDGLIEDDDIELLINKLETLYWFVRWYNKASKDI